jgi:glycosyltransferase involved in cell wall biosynthesis
MKYSVVITSFNSEISIKKAIQGFLRQTVQPEEIIVIDDFSQDGTWAVLNKISQSNSKLIALRNSKNYGQSYSRNLGVKYARSSVVIFGDDDDVSLPVRAALHLEQFRNKTDIDFVSSRKIYSSKYATEAKNANLAVTTVEIKEFGRKLLLGTDYKSLDLFVPASTCAVRKKAFTEVGGYDVDLRRLEDVDLALKFSSNGYKFTFNSKIAVYRYHSIGTNKGGAIDPRFQEMLLLKYASLLNADELNESITAAKLRGLYFSHKYLILVVKIFSNRMVAKIVLKKFKVIVKRIYHDFTIRRK